MRTLTKAVTMPKAWRPCQRHEDPDKGNDHAKGMETMPKAWRLAKVILTMPKAY